MTQQKIGKNRIMDTSQYFYRNVILSMVGSEVSLIDILNPTVKGQTLDPWFGLVLQHANGQRTIEKLYEDVGLRYTGTPPANLKETLNSVIERLVDLRFIVLTKEAVELPYYLSLPFEQMDINKALRLLKEDNVKLE